MILLPIARPALVAGRRTSSRSTACRPRTRRRRCPPARTPAADPIFSRAARTSSSVLFTRMRDLPVRVAELLGLAEQRARRPSARPASRPSGSRPRRPPIPPCAAGTTGQCASAPYTVSTVHPRRNASRMTNRRSAVGPRSGPREPRSSLSASQRRRPCRPRRNRPGRFPASGSPSETTA